MPSATKELIDRSQMILGTYEALFVLKKQFDSAYPGSGG
jgi:hypothetical protein